MLEKLKFPVFSSCFEGSPAATISVATLVDAVRTGKKIADFEFYKKCQAVRSAVMAGKSKDEVRTLKIKLPKVHPSTLHQAGQSKKDNGNLTGVIHFDLDHIDEARIPTIKKQLQEISPTPFLIFTSPSGQGLKVFFYTTLGGKSLDDGEKFKKVWGTLKDTMEAQVGVCIGTDTSQKNAHSGFFMSHDPELYFDPSVPPIDVTQLLTKNSMVPIRDPHRDMDTKNSPPTQQNPSRKIEKNMGGKPDPAILPLQSDIIKALSWMSSKKIDRALEAISRYFDTPIGVKQRYIQFFETAATLCVLGKERQGQRWTQKELGDLLRLIDYDKSRSNKSQILSTLQSLEQYGHFDSTADRSPPKKPFSCPNTARNLEHLKNFAKPDLVLSSKKFVSEVQSELLESLKNHRILSVLSRTGSGKSTWALSVLPYQTKSHIFFIVPLISLRDQLKSKWGHLDFIEFPGEGDSIDIENRRVHVMTTEKLVWTRHQIENLDDVLVVVDEAHLLSLGFRAWASKILLSWLTDEALGRMKWLFMSATLQALTTCLKPKIPIFFVEIRSDRPSPKVKFSVVGDQESLLFRRIEEIFESEPDAKILVFKNNKKVLDTWSEKLNRRWISSLVVSRDTREHDAVAGIWDQSGVPSEKVILTTSVSQCGVEMEFCTHTIICDPPSAESLIQMADRTRRDFAPVEVILKKGYQSVEFFNQFSPIFLSKYIQKISRYLKLELNNLKFLCGSHEIFESRMSDIFEGLEKMWDGTGEDPLTVKGVIMPKTVRKSQVCKAQNLQTWCESVQGFAKNLVDLEQRNERDLGYLRTKLHFLWGVQTDLEIVDDSELVPSEEAAPQDAFEILRAELPKITNLLLKDVSEKAKEVLEQAVLPAPQISQAIRILEYRFSQLWTAGFEPWDFLLVDESTWKKILYGISVRGCREPDGHLIPLTIHQYLKEKQLYGIFFTGDDFRKVLEEVRVRVRVSTTHRVDELLACSDASISRFFQTILCGQDARISKGGRRLRGFIPTTAIWETLKNRT